ncbi:type II toxin-antitoxin system RelE/ParE family toxin [Candidatus Nucleicultrix amoebiphila]|jgi:mRNA-degrading endonuclease RelE of RelBE toxin-antitoxin system|uniref:RelE/StbE family addiction module toxin n=1 Tax=Candidatus Nucleicultrix amoebiphila FS5 TaxID=1414854 RepID=A0A1W6N4T5_9PROT|nr:RelE/StbE family addiction module toxin [Candidatus Nucleicultrix amoebiphila FS5]
MQIFQTPSFKKIIKKLHKNQKKSLDEEIKKLMQTPLMGELKKGDLAGVRVHKFYLISTLSLLAYTYNDEHQTLTLHYLGSHENFYRDLKSKR